MAAIRKVPLLSLIIPAYRQEKTIVRDVTRIKSILDTLRYSYEIIVVVDGKVDKTFDRVQKVAIPKIKVVGYDQNKGKGYAVRYGFGQAKGQIIAFIDAGMDLDPRGIATLIEKMEESNADIVIGSKLHANSHVTYPIQRKVLSWGYRMFVKICFGLSVKDTQVGLKIFRRKVLEKVLPRLLVKRYAFDIEILAVANHLGYKKIYEAPITLTFNNWSSITSSNFIKPISNMLWDTLAVFYRLRILHYYDNRSKRKWMRDSDLTLQVTA